MSLISKKVLNEMDYTPQADIEIYSSNNIVIFKPSVTVDKVSIFQDYYHIILPLTQQVPIKVEKREYITLKNYLFFINPQQMIESMYFGKVDPYWAIFIEKDFVKEILSPLDGIVNTLIPNDNYRIDKEFLYLINRFNKEAQYGQIGSDLVLQCLSTEIIIHLFRYIQNSSNSYKNGLKASCKNISRVIEYITTYYKNNITLEKLSALVNFSPYYFIRVFKSETGKTPYEYLIDIRIQKAMEMLEGRDFNISEIGNECGFSNPNHFYIMFKKKTGVSPSMYRKKNTR